MSNENTALVTTESFNAVEVRRAAETSAIAMAAKAKASVEAACVMAERHPRDILQVRAQLLRECERPRFAESARYKLPRTKYNPETGQREPVDIVGFTIRFAEAALRHMGNMSGSTEIVFEDEEKLHVLVTVRDYERNAFLEDTVVITKTTERTFLKKGEMPISVRQNSQNKTVYLLPATADEIMQRRNAARSKAMRTLILGLLPGDIKDECEERCKAVTSNKFAQDPSAEIKRIVDAFAGIRVLPAQLSEYLGHSVETLDLAELQTLRGIYQAISDGEATWADLLDVRRAERAPTEDGEITMTPRQAAVAEALEKTKRRQAEQAASKAAAKSRSSSVQQQTAQERDRLPDSESPNTRMREPGED